MRIEFDKRLELIYGLLYCVNRDMNNNLHKGLFIEEMPNYNNEFYKIYKENASDELIDYIKNYGINGNWNQPCFIALSMDDNYNIIENESLIKEVINKNDIFDKNKVERLIKEFVDKSKYEVFYNNHKDFYEKIIKSYKESMSKFNIDIDTYIEDFYGYKVGNMCIKLYNFSSGSMGVVINNDQYYIQRVHNIGNSENDFVFKPKLSNMIHEFSHPYINPLVEKYFYDIDCNDIYQEILKNDLTKDFSNVYKVIKPCNAYTILMEYNVRAVTVSMLKNLLSDADIKKEILKQEECGLIHISDLVGLYDIKNNYDNFDDFFKNEIVNYFLKVKDILKYEKNR